MTDWNAFQEDAFQDDTFQEADGPIPIDFSSVQLDKGSMFQHMPIYRGPTLGWVHTAIIPAIDVTNPSSNPLEIAVGPGVTVLMNKANVQVMVFLPDVAAWLLEPHYHPQNAFDGSLWIKDYSGILESFPMYVVGYGTQTIDKFPSIQIITSYNLTRFYPLSDLSGWFIGDWP